MVKAELLLRGSPCLHHSHCRCAALFNSGHAGAKMPQTLPATCIFAPVPSGNCSNASATNHPASKPLTGLDRGKRLKTIPSRHWHWPYASSIRAGEPATSACVWPTWQGQSRCPANVPCSVGFAASSSRLLPPDAAPPPRPNGPRSPTTLGRWTRWSSYVWGAARASAGCD